MKIWIIVAVSLIIFGGLILTVTACAANPNFNTLFGNELEEKKAEVTDNFNGIELHTDVADITLTRSEGGKCEIISNDHKKIEYSAFVENDVLKIKTVDARKWYERIFNSRTPSLTVYLPKSEFSSLTIDESTGNITAASFDFGNVDIKLSTGNVKLENITANQIQIESSTGDINLNTVDCDKDLRIEVSTGDVHLKSIKCNNLTSAGDTGNITIEDITAKNASIERSTGKINVTEANINGNLSFEVSTGKCEITDVRCSNLISEGDTGNIIITDVIAEGKFDIERSTGYVKFDSSDAAEIFVETDTGNVTGSLLTEKVFIVRTDTGKIDVPKTVTGGRCEITTDTGNVTITTN